MEEKRKRTKKNEEVRKTRKNKKEQQRTTMNNKDQRRATKIIFHGYISKDQLFFGVQEQAS